MKNSILSLIIIALLCSCSLKNSETIDESETIGESESTACFYTNHILWVILVDEEFNNKLNPESPSYFGDEFIQKMEVTYLIEGRKLTHLQAYYYAGGDNKFWRDDIEKWSPIMHPCNCVNLLDAIIDPSKGLCYLLDCTSDWGLFIEDDQEVSYTYIPYPDGSEDVIKMEIYNNHSINCGISIQGKIWVNGELAFEREEQNLGNNYYNPKFFPFMKPIIQDGIQVGEKPAIYEDIIVIAK